jgi:hypothetical protein
MPGKTSPTPFPAGPSAVPLDPSTTAEGVVEALGLDQFGAIHAPAVGLVRWRRRLDEELLAEAAGLLAEPNLDLHALGTVASLPAQMAALLPDQPALLADLTTLGEAHARLAGVDRLRLRLRRIDGDGCRRWHVDNVALRLLCTYLGAATEILPDPEAGIVRDGGQLESTMTAFGLGLGEVALFRGGKDGGGVVHRSPPIAGAGQTRLVLVIDEGLQRA